MSIAYLTPDKDSYMVSTLANTNFGTGTTLVIGRTTGRGGIVTTYHGILAWNLIQLPAGSVINSAKVQLYLTVGIIGSSIPVRLFRCPTAWVENEVTWNAASNSLNWFTLGGDEDSGSEIADTISASTPGVKAIEATAIVQDAIANRSGFCNIVIKWPFTGLFTSASGTFGSLQNGNLAFRPTLYVDYTPPAILYRRSLERGLDRAVV